MTTPPVNVAPVNVAPLTVAPLTVAPLTVAPVTVPGLPVTTTYAGPPTPPGGGPSAPSDLSSANPPSPPPSGPAAPAPAPPSRRQGPAGGGAIRSARGSSTPQITGPLPLRLRRAVSETAQELSFPLALAVAILIFLVLQPRLDRNDLSVAHPGTGSDDDLLGFS